MEIKENKPISIEKLIVKLENEYSQELAIEIAKRICYDYLVTKKIKLKRAEFFLDKVQKIVNKMEN